MKGVTTQFLCLQSTKLPSTQGFTTILRAVVKPRTSQYPFDLLLQVTPGYAQLAHYIHTALSDFERRLPLVDFQSHKQYSEGLPRSLE